MRTSAAARSQAFLVVCLGAIAAAIVLAIVLPTGRSPQSSQARSEGVRLGSRRPAPLPTHRTPRPHGTYVAVAVGVHPTGRAIPADFLGLSFEAGEMHWLEDWRGGGDMPALLKSLGHGVLRFGGLSADTRAGWLAEGATPKRWQSRPITRQMLAQLASLAKRSGWKVLLSVNLGHYDPKAAAEEVAAAKQLMGRRLIGVEVGNEPDRYFVEGLRPSGWNVPRYLHEVAAYRRAIEAAAPGVPLAGPDSSNGITALPWVQQTAAKHPAMLTTHFYPLSKCGYTPVVSELLSPVTRAKDAEMLSALTKIAGETKIPVLLDESNNISCGGQSGVSNSFASALWATGYIAEAMSSGISGLYFHDLLAEPAAYSPLAAHGLASLQAGHLKANPEWYALLLAHRLIGRRPTSARVLGETAQGTPTGDLTAAAFRGRRGSIRVVLDNYAEPGSEPLAVHLRVPGDYRGGPIVRLLGPSPSSLTGTRLAGKAVSPTGSWRPRTPVPAVYRHRRHLLVQMPPSSAALVTLLPRRR